MSLSELQESIEYRGITDGERRYVRRCEKAYEKGAATGAPPVRMFLEACLEWLEADLKLKIEEIIHQNGPMPRWAEWVLRVGEDRVAYLTLKAALNGHAAHPKSHATSRPLRHVCRILMGMLMDELRAEIFVTADLPAYANAVNHGTGTKLQRSLRLRRRMGLHGVECPPPPGMKETIDVGSHLLMAMCESTGAFNIESVRDFTKPNYQTALVLIPAEATLEWIATRSDRLRLTFPIHPPTLIPPRDWQRGSTGGYHYGLVDTLPLVRRASPAQQLRLGAQDTPLVFAALNALQRTPWRINSRVLETLRLALDGRVENLIPSPHDTIAPTRPDWTEDPVEARNRRIRAAEIHTENEQRRVKRGDAERAMVVAEQVKGFERFYFPYSLDFRGRAYPAVEFLNPHGPDVVRGLLEFADGVSLSRQGAGWLAVHGANCLGEVEGKKLTKLAFQERVDAIKEITPRILSVAEDPVGTRYFWGAADEPWQFLAFCFEWAEYVNEGTVESHLPVGLDGTANGLQHYSAMLRDPVGARAVNMVSRDRPADLYSVVADAVVEKLTAQGTEQLAQLWLASGLVTRSICKRPVMTLPYGATRYGFVDQILNTLRSDKETWTTARRVFGVAHVRIRPAVQYLSAILWEVLGSTVGGALAAMTWLQDSAQAVVDITGGPISWTVPVTSFPAHMEYWKQRKVRVQTRMNGSTLRPSAWVPTNKKDGQKIKNAIAPNFVHSLDASAMCATTVACAARGVPSFSMVHDSYAVHAEYIPTLADAIRTCFIDLYFGRNVLMDLANEWRALGAEIPDPPPLGTFDVREVRQSTFFFA